MLNSAFDDVGRKDFLCKSRRLPWIPHTSRHYPPVAFPDRCGLDDYFVHRLWFKYSSARVFLPHAFQHRSPIRRGGGYLSFRCGIVHSNSFRLRETGTTRLGGRRRREVDPDGTAKGAREQAFSVQPSGTNGVMTLWD